MQEQYAYASKWIDHAIQYCLHYSLARISLTGSNRNEGLMHGQPAWGSGQFVVAMLNVFTLRSLPWRIAPARDSCVPSAELHALHGASFTPRAAARPLMNHHAVWTVWLAHATWFTVI